jgi:hypothetical protein
VGDARRLVGGERGRPVLVVGVEVRRRVAREDRQRAQRVGILGLVLVGLDGLVVPRLLGGGDAERQVPHLVRRAQLLALRLARERVELAVLVVDDRLVAHLQPLDLARQVRHVVLEPGDVVLERRDHLVLPRARRHRGRRRRPARRREHDRQQRHRHDGDADGEAVVLVGDELVLVGARLLRRRHRRRQAAADRRGEFGGFFFLFLLLGLERLGRRRGLLGKFCGCADKLDGVRARNLGVGDDLEVVLLHICAPTSGRMGNEPFAADLPRNLK